MTSFMNAPLTEPLNVSESSPQRLNFVTENRLLSEFRLKKFYFQLRVNETCDAVELSSSSRKKEIPVDSRN